MAPTISTAITMALSGAILLLLFKGRSLNNLLQEERDLATKSISERDSVLEQIRGERELLAKNYRDLDTLKKQVDSENGRLSEDVKDHEASIQELETQAESDQDHISNLEDEVADSKSESEAKIKNLEEQLTAAQQQSVKDETSRLDATSKVAVAEAAMRKEQEKTALLVSEMAKFKSSMLQSAHTAAAAMNVPEKGQPEIAAQPEQENKAGEPEAKEEIQPDNAEQKEQPEESQPEEAKAEDSQPGESQAEGSQAEGNSEDEGAQVTDSGVKDDDLTSDTDDELKKSSFTSGISADELSSTN